MSVREKLAWAACAVLLVFLYLASSTDLIIKEREVEIHPVSIILNDVNDAYYQNFKKGVDQAARDYYADTSYTTLYDEISQEQQLQLISREMEDGAQAIVVIPVEGEALMDSLREQKSQIPFVVLGTAGGDSAVSSRISVDSREAGRRLAEEALKELPAGVSCCRCPIGRDGAGSGRSGKRAEGAWRGLRSPGDGRGRKSAGLFAGRI